MSIEEDVKKTAAAFSQRKTYFGEKGICWEFVHAALYKAGAKSFYDFNKVKPGEVDVLAPWGNSTSPPKAGCIALFKDVTWQSEVTHTVGRSIKTVRTDTFNHSLRKHVAIVLREFGKDVEIEVTDEKTKKKKKTKVNRRFVTIAQQGVPGAKETPSQLDVPWKKASGIIKFFPPESAGPNKAECPTPASKAIAREVDEMGG